MFSAGRPRRFVPQEGTKLAEEQRLIEKRCAQEKRGQKEEETETLGLTTNNPRKENRHNSRATHRTKGVGLASGDEGVATKRGHMDDDDLATCNN